MSDLRFIHEYKPQALKQGHEKFGVFPSGFLHLKTLSHDYKFTVDFDQNDELGQANVTDPNTVTINPYAISCIIKYPEAYLDPNSCTQAQKTTIEKYIEMVCRDYWAVNAIDQGGECETPFVMIKMISGETYLVPGEEAELQEALTVARQVLNGAYKPEAENAVSVRKRHALNRRGRIDKEAKRGGLQPL